MNKIVKFAGYGILSYFGYCFTRGLVWGIQNPYASDYEKAQKAVAIAHFKG